MKKSNRIVSFHDDKTFETLQGIQELTKTHMTTIVSNAVTLWLYNNQDIANKALSYTKKMKEVKLSLDIDDNQAIIPTHND